MFPNRTTASKRFAIVGTLAAAALATSGCATQGWVIDTVREMNKDLVARTAKLETTAAAEKTRVDQLTTQVGDVRTIAMDARGRGEAAGNAAKIADQKAEGVDARVSKALANRMKRAEVQQVAVTFDSGKWHMSAADHAALNDVMKVLMENPTYTADIVGYTDSVGKADRNVNLSWRRSETVRRFFVEKGADLNRFYFIGIGEQLSGDDARDAEKRAKNRRVTVIVYKPVAE